MANNVNLTKALADIRQYPGARTDRKVFKVIAEYSDGKGDFSSLKSPIADIIGASTPAVCISMERLERHGLLKSRHYDTPYRLYITYTVAPAYMLTPTAEDTHGSVDLAASVQRVTIAYINAVSAVAAVYAKEYGNLAEQLENTAEAIRKATGNN